MGFRERVADAAESASSASAGDVREAVRERTTEASRRAASTGSEVVRETTSAGSVARDGVADATDAARETVGTAFGRFDLPDVAVGPPDVGITPSDVAIDPPDVAAPTGESPSAAAVAEEIQAIVDDVDRRYAARNALEGARYGITAGPYGAAVGAGVGTAYGAYSSTRGAFDPDDPSGPVGERVESVTEGVDAGRYLDGVRHAKTGYRVGGKLGTEGKIAGAALGGGGSLLAALLREHSGDDESLGELLADDRLEPLVGVASGVGDRLGPVGDALEDGARRTGAVLAENRETVEHLGVVAASVDWARAQEAATQSFAAFSRVAGQPGTVGKVVEGSRAVSESASLWYEVYADVQASTEA
ncbi:hypothetical protein DMJ13_12540 [halophilic archaeon]|nr:hypothetical protein DMJ13_12540 [halophilic archaeon]